MKACAFGVEADRLVIVGDGAVAGAALQEGVAAGIERVAVIGVQLNHAVEVLDRTIVLVVVVIGLGPRLQGREVVGVERDRPAEVGDRTIVLVFPAVSRSASHQRLDLPRDVVAEIELRRAGGDQRIGVGDLVDPAGGVGRCGWPFCPNSETSSLPS